MAIKTRVVELTTTPTVIASATVAQQSTAALSLSGASLYDVVPVTVFSNTTQPIYLGGSSASTASSNTGIPFVGAGGSYFTYNLMASDPLFGHTTNSTVSVIAQALRQSG